MIDKFERGLKLGTLSFATAVKALASSASLSLNPIKSDSMPAPSNALSFVSFSITPWFGVWQRPQQFATRFSTYYPGIYVDPMGIQHVLTKDASPEIHRHSDNLTVFCPRVLPMGKTRSTMITLNDALVIKKLEKLLHRSGLGQPVLVTNTPLADGIAEKFPWRAVVFDIIDDFTKWKWSPRDAEQREQRLLKRADTVFTGTYSLYEKKHSSHSETEFIPCGVEIDHFIRANDPLLQIPEDIRAIQAHGPVIGYFGGLNERIDSDLLVSLAESIPAASVVLIGPVFADFGLSDFEDKWASVLPGPNSPGFKLKPKPDNLHILGIRKYKDLPAYLKAFDVCLLPYVLSDATYDIHPVKGLEYLSSGRPVVSTPLPDVLTFYKGIIDVADSYDTFSETVRMLLENPDSGKAQERIAFARPKTWENMMERMREKILKACGIVL